MTLKTTLALAALLALPAVEASSATYTYVGSWNIFTGDYSNSQNPLIWNKNPPVYSGQEAAAFLFGGVFSDYVISTVSDQVADINFSAWVDGWGEYRVSGPLTPAAQGYSLATTGLGYNGCGIAQITCAGTAFSALVIDHGPYDGYTNYAFRISAVPLPAAGFLLIGALGGLGLFARRRT